jgi:hypothetical protein
LIPRQQPLPAQSLVAAGRRLLRPKKQKAGIT